MTVGIAAVCRHEGKPTIAMCCDWQGTYGSMLKSEDVHKIRSAGKASIIIADDPSAADEFVSLITPVFEQYDGLTKEEENFDMRITKLLSDIRACSKQMNAQRRDYFLSTKYNTTSELFRREGKDNFPSDMYYHILSEIGKVGLGCDLIIAYNADIEPIVIHVRGADCAVRWEDSYVAIGSGSWIALAVMCQEDYDDAMSLMDCLSRVYSAKTAAQKDPAVGIYTSIVVSTQDGEIELSDDGWNYLKEHLRPIQAAKNLEFKDAFVKVSGV